MRTKDSYLNAQFMRLKARSGAKKAIMAIAASMLTACFVMLRDEVPYKDLGAQHFDRDDTAKTISRLVKRLRRSAVKPTSNAPPKRESASEPDRLLG